MKKKLTRFVSLICIALFLTGALFLAGCSGDSEQSSGGTDGKSAEEIATDAFNNLEAAKNYDIDMNMLMSMEMMGQKMDIVMKGEGSFFTDPMKMKMNMNMDMGDMGMGEEVAIDMETYFLQEGNDYVMYTGVMGMWTKTTFPEDQLSTQMMQMSPADSMNLYMENLKEAVKEGEEKIGNANTEKIKLVASGDIFKELMDSMNMDDLGLTAPMDSFTADAIRNIGDLTYYIWVDKADSSLVKVQMDLSSAMHSMGALMTGDNAMPEMDEMSDMEKEVLKQTFENMTVIVDYSIKNVNKAADFTLPEAAANAVEMPLN